MDKSKLLNELTQNPFLNQMRNDLFNHKIYNAIKTKEHMKIFMEAHIFAVWDFMVLLKSLQNWLTCTSPLWIPTKNTNSARFINLIVLGEETDEILPGKIISHYELYLQAMKDIGADVTEIELFIGKIERGVDPFVAINESKIDDFVKEFVKNTFRVAFGNDISCIVSSFYFGREDPIPKMFQKFINEIEDDPIYANVKLYLQRHIDVDSDEHGPLSYKLLEETYVNDKSLNVIIESGISAIQFRIILWNGILDKIQTID